MKRDTHQLITDAFINTVEDTSLSRVRIADIISDLSINRNTFYYHFSNKYEVALSILRYDLDKELRTSFSERELVSAPIDSKNASQEVYSYYVHVETGARTLDCSRFLKALVRCTLQRQTFYRKLFDIRELEFRQCVTSLYYPAFQNDIRFILDGRYMPDETCHMLALHCSNYIVSIIAFCLESAERESLLDDRVNPFWNIIHESLYAAIQSHPINRYIAKP